MHWYKIFTPVIFIINVVVALGLLASAYAGVIDPDVLSICTVINMTFPLWILGAILMLIIDLLWWRWHAAVIGAAIFVALPQMWNYCPLNIFDHSVSEQEEARSFTLMTYNVTRFVDIQDQYPDSINPTLQYILTTSPDIACLQEVYTVDKDKTTHINSEQLDSLHRMYPYVFLSGHRQCVFSKFPIKPLELDNKFIRNLGADMGAYRVEIKGRKFTLFNVHMQSLGLTHEDKELYRDVIKMKGKDKMQEVKSQLVSKISQAGVERAHQTQYLLRLIKHYGGENVIVCGDFNDAPGCYSLRQLTDEAGLKEVFPQVGFGPCITFNANRLYFRIDHILYRGELKPVKVVRGNQKSSDHYPLTATFVLAEK